MRQLYDTLGPTDLVVHASFDGIHENSMEGWHNLGQSYCKAVERGAVFLYVMPRSIPTCFNGYEHEFFSCFDPEEGMAILRERVVAKDIAFDRAEQSILLFQPERCCFWTPSFEFRFFSLADHQNKRENFLLASLVNRWDPDSTLPLVASNPMRRAFDSMLRTFLLEEQRLNHLYRRLLQAPNRYCVSGYLRGSRFFGHHF